MNSDRYVGDSKLHEMVAIAMEENWDVCKSHMECITGMFAAVIADGVASGEFRAPDVGVAGTLHRHGDGPLLSSAIDQRICR